MAGTAAEQEAFQRTLHAVMPWGAAVTLMRGNGTPTPFADTVLVPSLTVLGGTADAEGQPLWWVLLGDADSPLAEEQGQSATVLTREPVEQRGDLYWLPALDPSGDHTDPERWVLVRPNLSEGEKARLEELIT